MLVSRWCRCSLQLLGRFLYHRPDDDLASSKHVAKIKQMKSTSCVDGNLLFLYIKHNGVTNIKNDYLLQNLLKFRSKDVKTLAAK